MKKYKFIGKTLIGFTTMICFQLPAIANNFPTNAKALARDDQSTIIYYLDQAVAEKRSKELLLVLQGSDCNSVKKIESVHAVLRHVRLEADLLTIEKVGIDASLPYSKKADRSDCPKHYIQTDSPELRAEDAINVLESILATHQYDSVILLGGSEGALVANLITAQVNIIDASIVFNGGGRWFFDDVLYNVGVTSKTTQQAEDDTAGLTGFTQHILSSEPFDVEVSGHGYRWWRNALEIDQLSLLAKTDSPVLLIQSQKDKSVSPILVNKMVSELAAIGKKNIRYLEYGSLDHGLRDRDGVSRMDEVVEDIKAWLDETL